MESLTTSPAKLGCDVITEIHGDSGSVGNMVPVLSVLSTEIWRCHMSWSESNPFQPCPVSSLESRGTLTGHLHQASGWRSWEKNQLSLWKNPGILESLEEVSAHYRDNEKIYLSDCLSREDEGYQNGPSQLPLMGASDTKCQVCHHVLASSSGSREESITVVLIKKVREKKDSY